MYTLDWLIEKEKTEPQKYLFFWGHQPSKEGSITAACFSQWWNSTFVVENKTYFTAEHWMMEKKALLFGDDETAAKILQAKTPGEAKKLGREVRNFEEEIWLQKRFELVIEGNVQKFSQHPDLKKFLLTTGNKILVEASPVDAIWGIGLAASDPRAQLPHTWRGSNLLGFALMEVRDKLSD